MSVEIKPSVSKNTCLFELEEEEEEEEAVDLRENLKES